MVSRIANQIDWTIAASAVLLSLAGLATMFSFGGENILFWKQVIWLVVSVCVMVGASRVDWRFMKNGWLLVLFFGILSSILFALIVFGHTVRGVSSWVSFGGISIQPADFTKLLVIVLLAKYFSRRHIEIANIRHILVSGAYVLVPFVLVAAQPDFGSAAIIFLIWLGMILVSGMSKRHLAMVALGGITVFAVLWISVFKPYQKDRILSFLNPLADVQGAGYNAFQSQIAVGSGQLLGKGVGYGTQSRLRFLPEFQTDFIFAAFAEEWGFVGVFLLCALFSVLMWKILQMSMVASTNFEMLFGMGLTIYLLSHMVIHIGMNMGVMPVTGIPLPFLSYGGSHLLTEYLALGMLMGMNKFSHAAHRDDMRNEFVGAWG